MFKALEPPTMDCKKVQTDWFKLPEGETANTTYIDRMYGVADPGKDGCYTLYHEVARSTFGLTYMARQEVDQGLALKDVLIKQALWQTQQEKSGRATVNHTSLSGAACHYKGLLKKTGALPVAE